MSAQEPHTPIGRRDVTFGGGGPAMLVAAVIGIIGIALFVVGLGANKRQAYHSYLAAYVFVVSLPIGALIFICIGHAMGSKWFVAVRRIPEAMVGAFPILALLFIPIVLGMKQLFPWVKGAEFTIPDMANAHWQHLMHVKRPYLNENGFIIRGIVYLAIWIILAEVFRRWSFKQDRDPNVLISSPRKLSGPALPLIAFSLTFAAFDWMMSLSPAWYSAAFGLYWFAGSFMAAMATMILLAARGKATTMPHLLTPGHFGALGRLMFAFVVVWAYIAYAQGFITWIANKPEEVPWYLERIRNGWGTVGIFLIVGHFALPFLILLQKDLKRKPKQIAVAAVWLLIVHYVDMHWLVLPALHHTFKPHWLDLACIAGVGGLAVAFALFRQRGRLVVPVGDPRLETGLRYIGT